jgi:hypothetical protein
VAYALKHIFMWERVNCGQQMSGYYYFSET